MLSGSAGKWYNFLMSSLALSQATKCLISQCDEAGLDDLEERAHTIAGALQDMGARTAHAVSRQTDHDIIFLERQGGEQKVRERFTKECWWTGVSMGTHLIDPRLGLSESSEILKAVHDEALTQYPGGGRRATSSWKGRVEPLIGARSTQLVSIDKELQRVLLQAETLSVGERWDLHLAGLATSGPLASISVGSSLALMAGVATHMVVYEQLPIATHRLVENRRLGERCALTRRGVRVVSELIDEPLFETMSLPVGGSEMVSSWDEGFEVGAREGIESIPMNTLQSWDPKWESGAGHFNKIVELLSQRHRLLVGPASAPKKPRARF